MREAGGMIVLVSGILACVLAISTIQVGDIVMVLNSAESEVGRDPIFVPKPEVRSDFLIEDWASQLIRHGAIGLPMALLVLVLGAIVMNSHKTIYVCLLLGCSILGIFVGLSLSTGIGRDLLAAFMTSAFAGAILAAYSTFKGVDRVSDELREVIEGSEASNS